LADEIEKRRVDVTVFDYVSPRKGRVVLTVAFKQSK